MGSRDQCTRVARCSAAAPLSGNKETGRYAERPATLGRRSRSTLEVCTPPACPAPGLSNAANADAQQNPVECRSQITGSALGRLIWVLSGIFPIAPLLFFRQHEGTRWQNTPFYRHSWLSTGVFPAQRHQTSLDRTVHHRRFRVKTTTSSAPPHVARPDSRFARI